MVYWTEHRKVFKCNTNSFAVIVDNVKLLKYKRIKDIFPPCIKMCGSVYG